MERIEAATLAAWLAWAVAVWPEDEGAALGHQHAVQWAASELERRLCEDRPVQ